MELISHNDRTLTLCLSREEVATLSNALNEALENLDDWEFTSRMGASGEEVSRLLDALCRAEAT